MQTRIKPKQPRLDLKKGFIDLSHGAGGQAMARLIDQLFLAAFDNPWLAEKNDQAQFLVSEGKMVMATDAHVISPLFFPGGDIGSLSVHGTINDVAMAGAKPLHLAASFILEEGFPLADLKRIVVSMADAARAAEVTIVTGDTKVVEKGKADGVFITTTGIGVVPDGIHISGNAAKAGDHVLVNGYIGDHGVAVLSHRENVKFQTSLVSDSAALHDLVASMLAVTSELHCLRDPTRGGVAATLNELAQQSQVGFLLDETSIPVRPEVFGACELFGLDPLYVANEGKLLAICDPHHSEKLLDTMRQHPLGKHSAIIGEVVQDPYHFVQLKTNFGGKRIITPIVGEQLPRIC